MGNESKNSNSLSLVFSSMKMAIATMISRLLGLVREQVIAFYFGATNATDAFYVAYRIPNLLRDLFAEGAFSAAFVPEFTGEKQKSLDAANDLLWKLFLALFITTGLISLGTYLFAEQIVNLFAPSFIGDQFERTVSMVQIMSPFLLLVSLAALFMGALNSLKVFFLPSLAPATFNLAMILTMIFGIPYLRELSLTNPSFDPVAALAIGVLIGGFLQMVFQLPKLLSKGFMPKLSVMAKAWSDPRVVTVFKKLGPGLVGFAATQINLIVTTILATGAGVGAVSWLTFGFRIFQLPVGVLGVSVAGSNLVHFSEAWKANEHEKAIGVLKSAVSLILLLLLPAAIILAGLSDLIIKVLFERGEFNALDTSNTAYALRLYLLGLPFYGFYKLLVPVFYTLDRQKIPVYVSIFSIICNLIFCVLLIDEYGFKVLAFGTTLSMVVNSTIQFFLLGKELKLSSDIIFNMKNLKIFLAAALCLISIFFSNMIPFEINDSILKNLGILFMRSTCYISVFFISLVLMGEKQSVRSVIKKVLRK